MNLSVLIQKGENLFAQGKINQAEELFLNLLREFPNNADILNNLGVICHTLGRGLEGIEYLSNSLEVNPLHQDALANLISFCEQNGQWEKAAILLNKAVSQDCKNYEMFNKLAHAQINLGDMDGAIVSLRQSNDLQPEQKNLQTTLDALERCRVQENIQGYNKRRQTCQLQTTKQKLLDSKNNRILFIDFNPNNYTHSLANFLNKHGYYIDLAYSGLNPINQLNIYTNPYRKVLGITDLGGLIDYATYYNYNNVHIFNTPDKIKNYFELNNLKISENNIFDRPIDEIIRHYKNNTLIKYHQYNDVADKKISILMPTYNRPYFLKRVLSYISRYDYINPTVLVLDSSDQNKLHENENTIKNYKNILYFRFPSDTKFFKKIINGLNNVNTDYVTLCADDDFLTEEGIIESIKSLNKDKSLYSVKGKNLYYRTSINNLIEYDWFNGLEIPDCVERLIQITKGFVPSLIYQVFRTDKFKRMYSFIDKNSESLPDNNTFREYLFYFLVIATGKIRKINVDLNIRDKSIPRESEIKNFPHAVMEGTFNIEYVKLVNFLEKYITVIDGDTLKFKKNIQKIFCNFLTNFLKVPKENVIIHDNVFDIKQLEIGMKKSWVWPSCL